MKKTILVVDDQADIRRLIALTVGQQYNVQEACSGAEALIKVQKCKPDAVILDIMIPGTLNGLDVLEQIKSHENTQSIFVVMVTAKGLSTDVDCAIQKGANAYLVKPFSPLQLMRMLQEHFDS